MIKEEFERDSWYGDAWPNGPWVEQVIREPLRTSNGPVPLPPDEGWGLEFITLSKGGKFTGLAHDLPGRIWEWDGAKWVRHEYFSQGRCGYVGETLVGIEPAGVGFVDDAGHPISFILSHEPKNGLSQWSETAGLQFGQGSVDGGVLVFDGAVLRTLDTGPCQEIKVHREGDLVCVSYRHDIAGGRKRRYYTVDQIKQLPPVLPPQPKPEPVMDLNDPKYKIVYSTLKAERSKLPTTITSAEAGALLNTVAKIHAADGWGMLSKPSGNHAPVPGTNPVVYVSSDWLVNREVHLGTDCLGDGPDFDPPRSGPASPQWGAGVPFDESRFVTPVGSDIPTPATTHVYVGGGNDTGICDVCGKSRFDNIHAVPQAKIVHRYDGGEQDTGLCDICQKPGSDAIHGGGPIDPPPAGDDLKKLVESLAREQVALQAQIDSLAAKVPALGKLEERIKALEDKPVPEVKLPELMLVEDKDMNSDTQSLSTGSRLGHSHPVRWKIVKKPVR